MKISRLGLRRAAAQIPQGSPNGYAPLQPEPDQGIGQSHFTNRVMF
ncbi:MAG: hypothetical protein HC781_02545 [Leptolyngbyaceae cyanobacterium CSU_1_4]|nr:hypothetical protein [Leptolyngbyaceae cyanobacterium CSU_1_4]